MVLPKIIGALRRTTAIFGFYRRFYKKTAEILTPLHDLLKGHSKRNDRTPIQWTPQLTSCFERAKEELSKFTLLYYPRNDSILYVTTDASATAMGAVLEQMNDQNEREPLGFFSVKLDETQQNWSTYDRELYALYAPVEHFEHFTEGRDVVLVTDHRPLTHMFTTKKHCKLHRRSHQIEYLAQFTNKVIHISGSSNTVADSLSRPDECVEAVESEVTFERIAEAQDTDEEITNFRKDGLQGHMLREVMLPRGKSIICSVMDGKNRPIVPRPFQRQGYLQLHNLAHSGSKATMKLVRQRFYWRKMNSDIRNWVRCCLECQKNKVIRHTKSEFGKFPPSDRFEHVHTDIVGPLEESEEYQYLCTFTNRATH